MTPTFSPARSLRSVRPIRAFTILELLVVLAIIGMLATLAFKAVDGTLGKAGNATAKIFVTTTIKLPLTSYRIDTGGYPSTTEGLQALLVAPANKSDRWKGPYLEDDRIPLDPWGEAYQYRYPGVKNKAGYDVWSKGLDKQDGTADDVGNFTSPTAETK